MDRKTEQAALWNGTGGAAWVDGQALLDGAFAGLEALLIDSAGIDAGSRVLDIGCGTGSTTLAAARRIGEAGSATGADISAPMIALAERRAAEAGSPARFIVADAETHDFEPAGADRILSRFGVMFFEDSVRAFANLRRAASPGAELRFLSWRSPAENPFMTTASRAAAPLLPDLPKPDPNAPGQFAFADADRVRGMLAESGWSGIDLQPVALPCAFPAEQLDFYFTRLGPLAGVLPELAPDLRARVIDTARAAFQPFVEEGEVRFVAACWLTAARA